MIKKLILILATSSLLIGCQPQPSQPEAQSETEELPLSPEMSDGLPTNDSAGGIAPAGTPIPQDAPIVEFVKAALAAKYPAGEMDSAQIKVVEQTDTHFHGIVKPNDGLEGQTGGGYVFAAKDENGDWIITADGQGTISCDAANLYNFPASMISECTDENTGQSVAR